MKLLDLTLPSPVENLACDEALLDWCENGKGEEVLRFWEPREHFVVVGYANKIANEVNVAACEKRDIPILRRCSGGGTVLQGPGCLNYALVLRITDDGPLRNISSANQFIMERNRAAIESLFRTFNLQPLGAAKPGGDGSSFILHPSSFPCVATPTLSLAGANFPATHNAAGRIPCSFTGHFCWTSTCRSSANFYKCHQNSPTTAKTVLTASFW